VLTSLFLCAFIHSRPGADRLLQDHRRDQPQQVRDALPPRAAPDRERRARLQGTFGLLSMLCYALQRCLPRAMTPALSCKLFCAPLLCCSVTNNVLRCCGFILGAHGLRAARGLGHRGRRGVAAEGGRHVPVPAREHGRPPGDLLQAVRRAAAGLAGETELCFALSSLCVVWTLRGVALCT
jgi:hypothetical protein